MIVQQKFCRTVDGDGLVLNQLANEGETTLSYVVITHSPMLMSESPMIAIDSQVVESFNAVGSGSSYEMIRISSTQTIILKNVSNTALIEYVVGGAAPIDDAIIEESFIIQ